MAGPPTITESGLLYMVQHQEKRRRIPSFMGMRHRKASVRLQVPALVRALCWLETFSPPKVLLTLVGDARPSTPPTSSKQGASQDQTNQES
jgi:hypothetical protein